MGASAKKPTSEFGYGDPLADVGTPGWARRVRVVLLNAVEGAQFQVHNLRNIIEQFVKNRGWSLLDSQDGKTYRHFEDFVSSPRPWGLGTDYQKFRSLLISEIGERELDRWAISEPGEAGRPKEGDNMHIQCADSKHRNTASRLRAINRAPANIQNLYDEDLIAVDLAAKFGPADEEKRKEMERRAEVLQGRVDATRIFRPNLPHRTLKREINDAARDVLELREETPFERILKLLPKLDAKEKERLRRLLDK